MWYHVKPNRIKYCLACERCNKLLAPYSGIDFEGNQLFKALVPGMAGSAHLIAAEAAPDRPWVAAGYSGGPIVVIDVDAGSVIASYAAPGVRGLCWLEGDEGPLLVYTTGERLEARRLVQNIEAQAVDP